MRLAMVVNPAAGGGRGRRVLDAALPLLEARGVQPDVAVSINGEEPARLARQAAEAGAELVVAVGGDGQARAVASGLLGTPAALGILPAGSANDYARALGMPRRDLPAAVDLLLGAGRRQLDVVRVEGAFGVVHYLNVGGAGFDSVVAATADRIPLLRGSMRYALAVLRELPRFRAGHFRLVVDGAERELRAMVVVVANGASYGGGMHVAPGASLTSGRLELCIVAELSSFAFLRAFPRVYRGTHVDHPAVTMLPAREVLIEAEPAYEVTGDGERLGRLPARFSVLPGALNAAIGRRAPLR
ncbi:MAG TPA: diacylglycerol kinase family protein [Candidatus Limnocylindria bacterium]|nr:diacylglycerol kinase family protein [Candidatus Limnocylindria bacterium]